MFTRKHIVGNALIMGFIIEKKKFQKGKSKKTSNFLDHNTMYPEF